jgi:flagellar motor component MotA
MLARNLLLFALLSLGLIWGGLTLANIPAGRMISYSVLLMLSGITLGLMVVAYSLETHAKVWRTCLTGKRSQKSESSEMIAYFRGLAAIGLVSGLLGFMMGMAMLLENFNTPEELGPPVAIGIRSLAYGVVVRMVALGVANRLDTREEINTSEA